MAGMNWLLSVLVLYLGAGVLFALGFVARGAGRLDENARGASWGFRLMTLPGAAALWPILLNKWARHAGPRTNPAIRDTRPHRRVHLVVWLLIPVISAAIVAWAWFAGVDPTGAPP